MKKVTGYKWEFFRFALNIPALSKHLLQYVRTGSYAPGRLHNHLHTL